MQADFTLPPALAAGVGKEGDILGGLAAAGDLDLDLLVRPGGGRHSPRGAAPAPPAPTHPAPPPRRTT